MEYEWDSDKDASNLQKHGLSLSDGVPALEDPYQTSWIDERYDYGEVRVITVGMSLTGVLYVVSTDVRDNLIRLISVRRAERHEQEIYDSSCA